jgi:hypothetical protein
MATKYCLASACYAVVRNAIRMRDSQQETPHLLSTEKLGIMVICAAYSPGLAPYWLWRDLINAEVYARGVDPTLYGCSKMPRTVLDYLLN